MATHGLDMKKFNLKKWHMENYKGLTLTDWYPSWIKPVRQGDYIIGSDWLCVLSYWNGKNWIRGNGTLLLDQNVCWRGVTHEV